MSSSGNKKVVVGLTGRVDSSVSAYILKKQGYDVIGVSLIFLNEGSHKAAQSAFLKSTERNPDKEFLYQVNVNSEQFTSNPLVSRCHLMDLQAVKKFCDSLNIPFYAVKAQNAFKDEVLDSAISSRISGQRNNPCLNCQKLKIDILLEKAELLGADFIATGHYAKIYHNHKTNTFSVLASNDEEYDQSYQLTNLSQKELKKLVLPLSEMRRAETVKLSQMIDSDLGKPSKGDDPCLYNDTRFPFYLESEVSMDLLKDGSFIDVHTEEILGDHYGIHYFTPGMSKLRIHSEKSTDPSLTIVNIDEGSGNIFVSDKKLISFRYAYVNQLVTEEKQDISRPVDCFAKLGDHDELLSCRIFFKNNNKALLEFESIRSEFIPPGEMVSFYARKGVGAKVLGSAKVVSCGLLQGDKLFPYKMKSEDSDDESEDIRIEFNPVLKF